jgi:hypothetical protein
MQINPLHLHSDSKSFAKGEPHIIIPLKALLHIKQKCWEIPIRSRFHSSKMSDADEDLVLASFGVSNDDQTPPPSILLLLLPNSQPRDLLHPRGQSINSRGGAPPPDTTFILFPIPQPHQLQDLQPGRRHYSNPDYYCQDVAAAADCPSPPPLRGSSPRSVEAAHPLASPTFKNKKWKTQMCSNGSACPYGSGCHFAHSKEELQKSTLHQLMQDHSDAKDEYPYLAYPCMFQIMYEEW